MKCINCGKTFESHRWPALRRRFRSFYRLGERLWPGDTFTCSLRCKKVIRDLKLVRRP